MRIRSANCSTETDNQVKTHSSMLSCSVALFFVALSCGPWLRKTSTITELDTFLYGNMLKNVSMRNKANMEKDGGCF